MPYATMSEIKRITYTLLVYMFILCAIPPGKVQAGTTAIPPVAVDPCYPPATCTVNDMIPIPANCTWFLRCLPGSPNYWDPEQCKQNNGTTPVCFNPVEGACNFCFLSSCYPECTTASPVTIGTPGPFDVCDIDGTCTWATNGELDGDPDNCTLYYTCVGGHNLHPQRCAPNNVCFDMNIMRCDFCNAPNLTCRSECPGTTTASMYTTLPVDSSVTTDLSKKTTEYVPRGTTADKVYTTNHGTSVHTAPPELTHDPGGPESTSAPPEPTKDPGNGETNWGLIIGLILLFILLIILLLLYIICKSKKKVYPDDKDILVTTENDTELNGGSGYKDVATTAPGAPPVSSTFPGAITPLPPIYSRFPPPKSYTPGSRSQRPGAEIEDNMSDIEEEKAPHLTDFEKRKIKEKKGRLQNEMDVEVSNVFEGGDREEVLEVPDNYHAPGHLEPITQTSKPKKKKKNKKRRNEEPTLAEPQTQPGGNIFPDNNETEV